MKKLSTLLLLVSIFSSAAVFSQSSVIDHTNQLNKFARAVWQGRDGNIVTQVFVSSVDKLSIKTNGGGKPFTESNTYLQYAVFDDMTGDLYALVEGFGPEGCAPSGNLMSASADYTFDVHDFGRDVYYRAHVQVDWAGYGKTDNWTQNRHYNFVSAQLHYSQHGVARAATATGSISFADSENVLNGLELVEGFIIKGGGSTNINIHKTRSQRIIKERPNEISIYPNPASNTLFVKNVTAKEFRIMNTMGAVVSQGNIENTVVSVDIAELPAGTYFIQFGTGAGKVVKTFVKQ